MPSCREAHAEKDPEKRLNLYLKAERKILAEVPVVPIGSFVIHWVAGPGVEGLEFDVMGGFDAVGISLTESGDPRLAIMPARPFPGGTLRPGPFPRRSGGIGRRARLRA